MLEFDVVFLLFLVLGMFQMAGFVVTLMKALVREISNNSGSLKRMKMAVSAAQGLIRARMPNATLKLKEFETLYALNPERFIPVYISSIDWNNFVFSYGFHRTEKKGVKAQAIGYYVCTDRSITSIRLPQMLTDWDNSIVHATDGDGENIAPPDKPNESWVFIALPSMVAQYQAEDFIADARRTRRAAMRKRNMGTNHFSAAREAARNGIIGADMLCEFARETADEQKEKLEITRREVEQSSARIASAQTGKSEQPLIIEQNMAVQGPTLESALAEGKETSSEIKLEL